MARLGWMIVWSLVLLAGGFALGVLTADRARAVLGTKTTAEQRHESRDRNTVFALGKLQPGRGLIPILGPPGDRIETVKVKVGATVEKGDTLLVLASAKDRQAEVQLVRNQLEEAEIQFKAIEASSTAKLDEIEQQLSGMEVMEKSDLKAQEMKIAFLKKQEKAALSRQNRLANLDPEVVPVSAQEKEQAALAVAQASSELEAAEAGLNASKKKYANQKKAAEASRESAKAEQKLAVARVPIKSLKQNLELAEMRLAHTTIKAPVDGTVVNILSHNGDPTGSGPILQIAAGKAMIAVAEVYATDVDILRGWLTSDKAIHAKITSPALGNKKLNGVVANSQAIALMVAKGAVAGFSPRADTDRRIVEVRVELNEKDWTQAKQFLGLEVNVEFSPSSATATGKP